MPYQLPDDKFEELSEKMENHPLTTEEMIAVVGDDQYKTNQNEYDSWDEAKEAVSDMSRKDLYEYISENPEEVFGNCRVTPTLRSLFVGRGVASLARLTKIDLIPLSMIRFNVTKESKEPKDKKNVKQSPRYAKGKKKTFEEQTMINIKGARTVYNAAKKALKNKEKGRGKSTPSFGDKKLLDLYKELGFSMKGIKSIQYRQDIALEILDAYYEDFMKKIDEEGDDQFYWEVVANTFPDDRAYEGLTIEEYKRFVSAIEDDMQFFAFNPARPCTERKGRDHPDAYSVQKLKQYAKIAGIPEWNKMSSRDLCEDLENHHRDEHKAIRDSLNQDVNSLTDLGDEPEKYFGDGTSYPLNVVQELAFRYGLDDVEKSRSDLIKYMKKKGKKANVDSPFSQKDFAANFTPIHSINGEDTVLTGIKPSESAMPSSSEEDTQDDTQDESEKSRRVGFVYSSSSPKSSSSRRSQSSSSTALMAASVSPPRRSNTSRSSMSGSSSSYSNPRYLSSSSRSAIMTKTPTGSETERSGDESSSGRSYYSSSASSKEEGEGCGCSRKD